MRDTAACPVCGRLGCPVKEQFVQATRWEPMLSLGDQGYCPDCQVHFKPEHVQEAISA